MTQHICISFQYGEHIPYDVGQKVVFFELVLQMEVVSEIVNLWD